MAKFLRFIVNTIMIVAIVVAASLLIPPFAGVNTLIVDDIEMETNLEIGSVTYAWGVDAGELKVGDKVLVQEDGDMVYCISSITESEFLLDNELDIDGESITKEFQDVVDKVILTVPFLGYVSMALRTVEGLIIVGLSVVFVIILFILAEIWRKEEEDEWEEEPDSKESGSKETDKKEESESHVENTGVLHEENSKTQTISKELENSEHNAETVSEAVMQEEQKTSDDIVVTDEFTQAEKDLFEETSNFLAADISSMMGLDNLNTNGEMVKKMKESIQKDIDTTNDAKATEKVLAMPLYTKEEWLERAKAAGDEPELIMDELSGVTFLDYSDVL